LLVSERFERKGTAMSKVCLMVSTEKGLFLLHSDDSRKHWEILPPALKGWKVNYCVIDPRTRLMYAAVGHYVYGPTIQISRDLGKTWEQQEHGPAFGKESTSKLKNIWTIVPGLDSDPNTLYAGTDDAGLFVSRDGGIHWEELTAISEHPTRAEWMGGAGGMCLHSILLDKDRPSRIWVGISAVGVLRSDDGGASFQPANEGMPIIIEGENHKCVGSCVHALVQDPAEPSRIFQQNHQGVLRTADGGDHWERIENGLPHVFGFPMCIDPHDASTLYIIPQEADEYRIFKNGLPIVYRTRNRGDQWQPLRNGLPENCYTGVLRHAMTMDTCDAPGLYFGTSSGQLFYSLDRAESWQTIPCSLPRISSVRAVVLDGAP
jgi:photosystem II stability/assembly factor-like uncharacterized protein